MGRRFGYACAALLATACTEPNTSSTPTSDGESSSSEPTTETSMSTTASTSSTTGMTTGADCPATHRCVPPWPESWVGPVALYRGAQSTSVPACGGEYPDAGVSLNADLDEGEPVCDCSCGDAVGEQCDDAVLSNHGSAACSTMDPDTWTLPLGMCIDISAAQLNFYEASGTVDPDAGLCPPIDNHDLPLPQWGSRVATCEGATLGEGCGGDELCVPTTPEGFDTRTCIFSEGDVDCPGEPYSEQILAHAAFDDERNCTPCTCSSPGGTCSGTVDLASDCPGGIKLGEVAVGDCSASIPNAQYALLQSLVPDASCNSFGGALLGTVNRTGTVTICCEP